jgi:hypothetical protein
MLRARGFEAQRAAAARIADDRRISAGGMSVMGHDLCFHGGHHKKKPRF